MTMIKIDKAGFRITPVLHNLLDISGMELIVEVWCCLVKMSFVYLSYFFCVLLSVTFVIRNNITSLFYFLLMGPSPLNSRKMIITGETHRLKIL